LDAPRRKPSIRYLHANIARNTWIDRHEYVVEEAIVVNVAKRSSHYE